MADAEGAPLVIVKGMAGTAKTFYTLAVGLHAMLEQEEPAYRRILISRPNAQFDDDIGFLPGDESEKIAPLLRPVVDNLELLVDQNEKERFADERSLSGKVEELFDRGIVDAQALNFIRGRSISKTYLVIDEAQNLRFDALEELRSLSDPDDLTGESGTGICLIGNSEVYSRMLGKQEAQFAQQFSRVRFRRRYSTADVKLADVEKLFPTLADGSHGKELAFMTGVCRSKWGIRGAMSVYTNAVRNENTSLDGLRGIAASMGVGVLS